MVYFKSNAMRMVNNSIVTYIVDALTHKLSTIVQAILSTQLTLNTRAGLSFIVS